MNRIVALVQRLYAEILKFGVVGSFGVLSDLIVTNSLWKTTGLSPTLAGVFGTCVATVVGYIGNRYWTFRNRPEGRRRREMALFALISAIGLIIENGYIFIADQILGFHSTTAYNIAKFGFGLVTAGAFRFWASHTLVFPEARPAHEAAGPPHPSTPSDLPVENGAGTPGH